MRCVLIIASTSPSPLKQEIGRRHLTDRSQIGVAYTGEQTAQPLTCDLGGVGAGASGTDRCGKLLEYTQRRCATPSPKPMRSAAAEPDPRGDRLPPGRPTAPRAPPTGAAPTASQGNVHQPSMRVERIKLKTSRG